MHQRIPPELDMTLDGRLLPPRRGRVAAGLPLGYRVAAVAALVAVIAGAVALAGLVLWAALTLLPVAIGAIIVAWLAVRLERWRAGRSPARRDLRRF